MDAGHVLNREGIKIIPYIYITLPTYILFAGIGAIIALIFLVLRMETYSISFLQFLSYLFVGGCFLLLFSRIFFAIAMIPSMETGRRIKEFFHYLVNGGIVFYGGLLGLLFGIAFLAKIRKDDLRNIYNFIAPAIPLFHMWARIGCLFAGCCYGIPWNWGVIMADSPEVIRFPVQIAESICDFIIFGVIIYCEKKKGKSGDNLKLYMLAYAFCRFILEFFRGDEVRGIWGKVSTAQIVSTIIGCTYMIKYIIVKKFKRVR